MNYSDWLVSGGEVRANDATSISSFNKKEFVAKPYSYQLDARNKDGNLFVTLPTGSGKTETALYWIAGNIFSNTDPVYEHKVFYTLPTTTTT